DQYDPELGVSGHSRADHEWRIGGRRIAMASSVCARRSTCSDDADHSASWLARRALLITWDAFGWAFALAVASSLRADFTIVDIETRPFLTIVAVAVTAQLAVHAVLRTYRGRHPIGGIDEAVTVA